MSDEILTSQFGVTDLGVFWQVRSKFDAAVEAGQQNNVALIWRNDSGNCVYKYNDMMHPLNTNESWTMVTTATEGEKGIFCDHLVSGLPKLRSYFSQLLAAKAALKKLSCVIAKSSSGPANVCLKQKRKDNAVCWTLFRVPA